MLSAKDILNTQDFKTNVVNVPEWGGEVKIKSLSAKAVDDLVSNEDESMITKAVKAVVAGCVDESGDPIFTADDVEKLIEKSQAPITKLSHEILVLTGLVSEDTKKK